MLEYASRPGRETAPDVMLTDSRMPVLDGITATHRIMAHHREDPPRVVTSPTG